MKSTINRLLAFGLIISMGVGCGDVEELNINPNEPTAVPAANLVTQAMFQLPNLYWSRDMNFEYGMLFVQHLAQDEYTEEQRYNFTAADFASGASHFHRWPLGLQSCTRRNASDYLNR